MKAPVYKMLVRLPAGIISPFYYTAEKLNNPHLDS
jgi:hypothetical protein